MDNPALGNRTKGYTAVRLRVLLYLACRNLLSKRLRSLLTIFGVVIGIGAIFFLMSFGLGLQHLVTTQIIGDQSIKSVDVSSPNSKLIQLDNKVVNKIKTLPHVKQVGAAHSFPGSLKSNGGEIDSVVYGVDIDYQGMISLSPVAGKLLTESDLEGVVINKSVTEAIGVKDYQKAIGRTITITVPLQSVTTPQKDIDRSFKIIGVIDSGSGTEVFMHAANFDVLGIDTYQDVRVIADHADSVASIRKQIESNGLQTTSPVDTLDQINQIFKFFTWVLIGFGSIGMVVSILGMFNTLTISLLERTREIGLMMALGGRNSDMRKLFIFEAALISLAGALLGIGLAIMHGYIVNYFMNEFAKGRGVTKGFMLFSSPFWAIALLTSVTLAVGLLVVYFPARRAQKINPIDALRRE